MLDEGDAEVVNEGLRGISAPERNIKMGRFYLMTYVHSKELLCEVEPGKYEKHEDPYIRGRVVIYGPSDEAVKRFTRNFRKNISPKDYIIFAESLKGGEEAELESINKLLCVLVPKRFNDKQIEIPSFSDENEAYKWICEIIENLPVGSDEKNKIKEAFSPQKSNLLRCHLLRPHGPVFIAKMLIELKGKIPREDIEEITKKPIKRKSSLGFIRHGREIPPEKVLKWILMCAEQYKLLPLE